MPIIPYDMDRIFNIQKTSDSVPSLLLGKSLQGSLASITTHFYEMH